MERAAVNDDTRRTTNSKASSQVPPRRSKFLPFGQPCIGKEEFAEVLDALRSRWLSTGPKTERFERMFAEYIGCSHACATNSCTAALHLSLIVAGIGPGDEVITTPMTFAATANAITHVGATPVFADIDPVTMNISPRQIASRLTERTKALLPVHLAGRPCEMGAIMRIARENGLTVIEDAAHATEARYHGEKIGRVGDLTGFSFYATKNVATTEGGMVTTENAEWAERIRLLSLHGMTKSAWKRYGSGPDMDCEIVEAGYKYNMPDIMAALGIHQLAKVEKHLDRRREIWRAYDQAFADLPVETPAPEEPDTVHARHLYTILLKLEEISITRNEFRRRLHDLGIGTGVHYVSLHLQPYYREKYRILPEQFPNALRVSERTVSLPLSPCMSDRDVEDVITAVRYTLE